MFGASPSGAADALSEIVFVGSWLLLTALGIVGIVLGFRFNRDEWPGLYAAWQARWLCHRCGELFEPGERRSAA